MNKMRNSEDHSKFLPWLMALMLSALLAACGGGGGQDPILGGGGIVSSTVNAKAITAFSLAGVAGTVDEAAKTIAVTLPSGTNVTALPATFTATGASVKVGTVVQTSGTTTNNFSAPVVYTVTAANGSTASYNVTVSVSSVTAKAITAYSLAGSTGTVDEAAKTIAVTLPNGTNLTALPATFSTTGASVKVGAVAQVSGTTTNNFTGPVAYTVTAADGSTATYNVSASASSVAAKTISGFSFAGYPGSAATINEAAKTIAVTVPNGTDVTALVASFSTTGSSVKVGAVVQTSGTTPNDFTTPVAYTVTAADGTTAIYAVTVTPVAASAKAITAYSIAGFPAVAGTIDEAAKTIAVTMPFGTDVTTLVATFTTTGQSVKVGTTVQTSTATANNFTAPVAYTVTAADASTATYTVTVSLAPNSAKAITAFSFAGFTGATGTVNEAAKTIAVTVPFGTDVTALVATFNSTGASVKVGAAVQVSATTANNFTAPVAYTVTAADASTATYTVTVTVAANSAKAITAYSFAGFSSSVGVINEAATPKTISVSVPPGTDLTNLVATFATTGTVVKVGAVTQTSAATANNFTTTVAYVVTAADATTATYNVSVTLGKGPAPVNLGATGGAFVLLSQSGVTDVPTSAVVGDVGTSPITGAAILLTCTEVTGNIYSVDAAGPAPCVLPNSGTRLTAAIGEMQAAYTDAAGRAIPDATNLGAGDISGMTLAPGLYKWTTGVAINTDVTLSGGPNDVWIFQISGNLTLANATKVLLLGGALPKNIFWQVVGDGVVDVTLGTTSHFEGIILSKNGINLRTGASINGRLYAQKAVTLQSSSVTKPAP